MHRLPQSAPRPATIAEWSGKPLLDEHCGNVNAIAVGNAEEPAIDIAIPIAGDERDLPLVQKIAEPAGRCGAQPCLFGTPGWVGLRGIDRRDAHLFTLDVECVTINNAIAPATDVTDPEATTPAADRNRLRLPACAAVYSGQPGDEPRLRNGDDHEENEQKPGYGLYGGGIMPLESTKGASLAHVGKAAKGPQKLD